MRKLVPMMAIAGVLLIASTAVGAGPSKELRTSTVAEGASAEGTGGRHRVFALGRALALSAALAVPHVGQIIEEPQRGWPHQASAGTWPERTTSTVRPQRLARSLSWVGTPEPATIARLQSAQGLRVLWWNIEGGAEDRRHERRALAHNLQQLIASPLAPDVIGLGEVGPDAIAPPVECALRQAYPYRDTLPYGDDREVSITVFSKHPIGRVRSAELTSAPPEANPLLARHYTDAWTRRARTAVSFVRPYVPFRVDVGGQQMDLLFLHLSNPWNIVRHRKGLVGVAWELLWGRRNPLFNQVAHLQRWLEQDYGRSIDRYPLLVAGDLNMPQRLGGLQTMPFSRLRNRLRDILGSPPRYSWPVPGSVPDARHWYPRLQIDHALVGPLMAATAAQVLPLGGADHFPLYVVVKPSAPFPFQPDPSWTAIPSTPWRLRGRRPTERRRGLANAIP